MAKRFKWQGEPVKTRFGYCEVHRDDYKPLCWYNYEKAIQALKEVVSEKDNLLIEQCKAMIKLVDKINP